MRGKKRASEVMPPVLALPPAIQKMSEKQASACAAESALVALESLTNSTRSLRPTGSRRWAGAGNGREPAVEGGSGGRERGRRAGRAGGVLGVGPAAQGADAADIGDGAGGTVPSLNDRFALKVEARAQRPAHGDASELFARSLDAVGHRRAPIIIDADNGNAVPLHARDQPLLHRGVVRERSVAV